MDDIITTATTYIVSITHKEWIWCNALAKKMFTSKDWQVFNEFQQDRKPLKEEDQEDWDALKALVAGFVDG